jgi:hypothetical protein
MSLLYVHGPLVIHASLQEDKSRAACYKRDASHHPAIAIHHLQRRLLVCISSKWSPHRHARFAHGGIADSDHRIGRPACHYLLAGIDVADYQRGA